MRLDAIINLAGVILKLTASRIENYRPARDAQGVGIPSALFLHSRRKVVVQSVIARYEAIPRLRDAEGYVHRGGGLLRTSQ